MHKATLPISQPMHPTITLVPCIVLLLMLLKPAWVIVLSDFFSLMFLVYTVLHFVFYYFTIAKQRPVSYAMMRDERLSIAAKIKQFPLYYFTKDKISQLTSLFTTDLSFVEMNIMEIIAGFVSSMIMTVVFALMLLSVDWRMALLLFAGIIPGYILYQQFQKSMVQLGEQKKIRRWQ